ncbi:MAG TPA: cyclase family protein [Polyangiales bacterium]
MLRCMLFFAIGLFGCRAPLASLRLVDLSHAFDAQTLYWPSERDGFRLQTLAEGQTEGGYYYSAYAFAGAEHGGTHVDAPVHFAEGRATADKIPLERLVAPAVVIDISRRAAVDADALVTAEDVANVPAGAIVLIRTGWSSRWPNRKAYFGDDTPGETTHLHFPGLSEAAAQRLVHCGVAAVGIDTPSIDHGPSRDFLAHRALLGADIPAFENLTALEQLPARGFYVAALPMKIAGGSGGPLRAVALIPR